jgi:hypothetical protein
VLYRIQLGGTQSRKVRIVAQKSRLNRHYYILCKLDYPDKYYMDSIAFAIAFQVNRSVSMRQKSHTGACVQTIIYM